MQIAALSVILLGSPQSVLRRLRERALGLQLLDLMLELLLSYVDAAFLATRDIVLTPKIELLDG